MSLLPLVKAWIWISVLASVAGWTLSAVGQLNRGGYAVFFGLAIAGVWLARRWRKDEGVGRRPALKTFRTQAWGGRMRRRFRRLLPASFALLAVLAFLGGALYPPSNHTALTYRIPRVLNWLTEGHWFWIHTDNYRMNDRACGIEWLSAPLLLFTRSDRALFLLNLFPFLLLPGLIFSLFTRLGVRARVAWHWMWLLPTGYAFILQAGSTGNDTFPTVYALAALDFACRAWASRRVSDLWLSGLAAALLTGAKASNLPLLLPWALLVLTLAPLLKRRPVLSLGVLLLAALVSFLPTAALNVVYCGDWSGLKMERVGMDMKSPVVGIWGNAFLFALYNFVPPFFPFAGWWNQHALSALPAAITGPLVANFEQGFHMLWEMPTEDWVGLGFGLSVLALVSTLAACMVHSRGSSGPARARAADHLPSRLRWIVVLSCWAALLAFCVKSGMATGARLIAPYYPLLLPLLLLLPGQAVIVRCRWWRVLAYLVLALAFPVMILAPGRPLWPARTVLAKLAARHPGQRLLARALTAYTVYGQRWDPLADVRALLPPGLTRVGFMGTGDDLDISLWRPLFTRRVEHIRFEDSAEQIRQRRIEYAVVGGLNFTLARVALADWLSQTRAEVVRTATVTVKVSEGPQTWYVVRFRD